MKHSVSALQNTDVPCVEHCFLPGLQVPAWQSTFVAQTCVVSFEHLRDWHFAVGAAQSVFAVQPVR